MYGAMWILVRACTRNQMEDYLVSELFAYPSGKQTSPDDSNKDVEIGGSGKKNSHLGVRKHVPSTFYNEILHSDDEVIDATTKNANLKEIFKRGRQM